jgi:hypothetical protein
MNHEIHEGIYDAVRQAACEGRLTYYGVIAPLAGLDMGRGEWDRAEIGRILGRISTREHEEGRPLLSAIVVHSHNFPIEALRGRPGKGFFNLARELGLFRPDEDEEAFWQREVRRVHEHWQGQQEGL